MVNIHPHKISIKNSIQYLQNVYLRKSKVIQIIAQSPKSTMKNILFPSNLFKYLRFYQRKSRWKINKNQNQHGKDATRTTLSQMQISTVEREIFRIIYRPASPVDRRFSDFYRNRVSHMHRMNQFYLEKKIDLFWIMDEPSARRKSELISPLVKMSRTVAERYEDYRLMSSVGSNLLKR